MVGLAAGSLLTRSPRAYNVISNTTAREQNVIRVFPCAPSAPRRVFVTDTDLAWCVMEGGS